MNIARISLAAGRVGFYDRVSGITLTPERPACDIPAGTNTEYLIEALQYGEINLMWGSLSLNKLVEKFNTSSRPGVAVPVSAAGTNDGYVVCGSSKPKEPTVEPPHNNGENPNPNNDGTVTPVPENGNSGTGISDSPPMGVGDDGNDTGHQKHEDTTITIDPREKEGFKEGIGRTPEIEEPVNPKKSAKKNK